MADQKQPVMHLNQSKIAAAKLVLSGPSAIITKATRSGFTTSVTAALDEMGIPSLIVAPTNKIQQSTVSQATSSFLPVLAHKNCERIKKKLARDPFLENLPITIPDCLECALMCDCAVFAARTDWAMTTSMTYAKLQALTLADSRESQEIRANLRDRIKVVIFDESHIIGRGSGATIDYNASIVIPEEFHGLRHIFHSRFWNLKEEHKEQAHSLESDADFLGVHSYYAFHVEIERPLDMDETRTAIGELIKIAKKRDFLGVSEEDILKLMAVITIMSGPTAVIHLMNDKERTRLLISSQTNILQLAIRDFVERVVPEAKVFFVSGSQFEPYQDFYEKLAGCDLPQKIYPDLSDSDSQMTIYPDTWGIDIRKIKSKKGPNILERVCNRIREISKLEGHARIYLLTINSRYCRALKGKLERELPNITFDYYRSANSIGVANAARVCIAIGAAEVPTNSFDHIAKDYMDSQRIRLLNVQADTWQAWSRVKDPAGKTPSKVYCIGIRKKRVSDIITWGLNRQVVVTGGACGPLKSVAQCGEQLGRPKIVMEERGDLRPSRRTFTDYIDAVVPVAELTSIKQKSYETTYKYIISENVRFLTTSLKLYNNPKTPEQIQQTLLALEVLFVTRTDKCGLQWKRPNPTGNFGYTTGAPPCKFSDLLRKHLDGKETIALPPFDSEDNCHFCAADFDDHKGDTPQSDNVKKFTGFLREKKLPHIVVKSGTNDGYHVFIPLVPTKTYTAMKFMTQLIKDAEIGDIKEIERYPKQKSIKTTRGGYGNQIKLPLGFNWKSGKKSMVVDTETLEPIDYAEISHAVVLCDVPEPVKGFKNKSRIVTEQTALAGDRIYGEMLPCIRMILDEGVQLNGSQGHLMRVAIAADALHCGFTEKTTVGLFKGQSDFIEDITTQHVRFIWANNYHRFNCEKLRENCGSLVCKYCGGCKNNGDSAIE